MSSLPSQAGNKSCLQYRKRWTFVLLPSYRTVRRFARRFNANVAKFVNKKKKFALFPVREICIEKIYGREIFYRISVIARAIFPKQSPLVVRGLLCREEHPPRSDEVTRICTVENREIKKETQLKGRVSLSFVIHPRSTRTCPNPARTGLPSSRSPTCPCPFRS